MTFRYLHLANITLNLALLAMPAHAENRIWEPEFSGRPVSERHQRKERLLAKKNIQFSAVISPRKPFVLKACVLTVVNTEFDVFMSVS